MQQKGSPCGLEGVSGGLKLALLGEGAKEWGKWAVIEVAYH